MAKTEDPEETEGTEAETEETSEPDHGGLSLGGLDAKIDALGEKIDKFIRGGTARKPTADQAEVVAGQVREEVGKIAEAENRRKAREDRIGALEAKVQKIIEAPPKEYRRMTVILWGEDDD